MKRSENRAAVKAEPNDNRSTDNRGKHASYGLAGKIHAAQSSAPNGSNDLEILRVAQEAHKRGVPAIDVWNEVLNDG